MGLNDDWRRLDRMGLGLNDDWRRLDRVELAVAFVVANGVSGFDALTSDAELVAFDLSLSLDLF
jgi:hypothetical protein